MSSAQIGGVQRSPAEAALQGAAVLWFAVVLAGQWAFALYILVYYGRAALAGDWAAWSERMITGFVEGEPIGNAAVIVHIALAFAVTFFGPLQFIPFIRERAIAFHRWNGRVYVTMAFIISLGALYMVWTRGSLDGAIGGPNSIAISITAALIVIFAAQTARFALARRIDIHQRWALRLFMVMSAVWFMRVGYGFWSLIHWGQRPPGVTRNLDGWFDLSLPYVATFLPLIVLEFYLSAKHGPSAPAKVPTAVVVLVSTVVVACGVTVFAGRWLQHLS